MTGAIILAAGMGERIGNVDKAFLNLGSKPMVVYSLLAFENCPDIDFIVLSVRKERVDGAREMAKLYGISKLTKIVAGGARRQDSMKEGLKAVPPESKVVVVHDAARPLVNAEIISMCVRSALDVGSGITAKKVVDTIKECEKGLVVSKTVDREKLWAVETPQAFRLSLLKKAIDKVSRSKITITDDARALEVAGERVQLVEWKKPNFKVTYVEDLQLVSTLIAQC